MMEGCNTAEQTSKILLDAHFPGSTEMGQIHPTCKQLDMDAANPDKDTDILNYQYCLSMNLVNITGTHTKLTSTSLSIKLSLQLIL